MQINIDSYVCLGMPNTSPLVKYLVFWIVFLFSVLCICYNLLSLPSLSTFSPDLLPIFPNLLSNRSSIFGIPLQCSDCSAVYFKSAIQYQADCQWSGCGLLQRCAVKIYLLHSITLFHSIVWMPSIIV